MKHRFDKRKYSEYGVSLDMSSRNPNHSSTLKKLGRLRRRERLRAEGYLAEDEDMLDLQNTARNVQDTKNDVQAYHALNATKGWKRYSLRRKTMGVENNKKAGLELVIATLKRAREYKRELDEAMGVPRAEDPLAIKIN